jgi:hypothetical protein
MSYATVDSQPNLLKKLFANKLEEMVFSKSELLKRAKKNTKVGGEDFSFSIRVTPTGGTSNDFTEAQASQSESQLEKFVVPIRREFTVMTIQDELIARTRASGNMGAFDEAVKVEAKAAVESAGFKLSRDAWQEGGGSMGVIGASTNVATTTLVSVGTSMLILSALWQVFDAISMTFSEALRAAGDTTWPMLARIVTAWLVFTPLAWTAVLVFDGGVTAVMVSVIGYIALLAVVLALRFASGRWRQIELVGTEPELI